MDELIASELADRRDEPLEALAHQADLATDLARALARLGDRSLVEDSNGARRARPEPGPHQSDCHFSTRIIVPFPTVVWMSKRSTNLRLPERPRPIVRVVEYPPASARSRLSMPGP
jgi:hypothetical protein